MGGSASMETREIKIVATERLIRKYNVNVCAFMETNFNWTKVNSLANLVSWFQEEEREVHCVTANNTSESNSVFSKHQPSGTGLLCRHKFLQYARKALRYLQLQLRTPHNPFTLEYDKWGHLAPLSWVKCFGVCCNTLICTSIWHFPQCLYLGKGVR